MKIIAFTILTDPDYRQDPWRESIRQALEVFDEVIVIHGKKEDDELLSKEFAGQKRISWYYLDWPQPDWSYEELPRHLNLGLDKCRAYGADWAVKFDSDMLFHEKEKDKIRKALLALKYEGIMLASFEKYQFFKVDMGYEKGKLPIAVNLKFNTCYGMDSGRYTDLCQPIVPDGKTKFNKAKYEIPKGPAIDPNKIKTTGLHVWNYDYSFKTEERSKELLFHFDRSHAKFWGAGYSGRKIEDITPDSAFNDYMALVQGRIKKCSHKFKTEDHPKYIQKRIAEIKPEEFGHSLWGKVKI